MLRAAVWARVGSAVVLYLCFVAIGGIDPGKTHVASGIALGLALLWLARTWRRLLAGG